jgi:hypothetical protein
VDLEVEELQALEAVVAEPADILDHLIAVEVLELHLHSQLVLHRV